MARLDYLRDILIKHGETRSDDDMHVLERLFSDIRPLRTVPGKYRQQLSLIMGYRRLTAGEELLTSSDSHVNFYLILSGMVHCPPEPNEEEGEEEERVKPRVQFGVGECVGDLGFSLYSNRPSGCVLVAAEPTECLTLDRDEVEKVLKMGDAARPSTSSDDVGFLLEHVPGFKNLSTVMRERLCQYFKKETFKRNDQIVGQGEEVQHALLIKDGECRMVSAGSPKGTGIRGFSSSTTVNKNLGILGVGQWIGEEALFSDSPQQVAIVATTTVTVLRVTKNDFFSRLPKDMIERLRANAQVKQNWRAQRLRSVSDVTEVISNIHKEKEETRAEIKRLFPNASVSSSCKIRSLQKIRTVKEQQGDMSSSLAGNTSLQDFAFKIVPNEVPLSQSFRKRNLRVETSFAASRSALSSPVTPTPIYGVDGIPSPRSASAILSSQQLPRLNNSSFASTPSPRPSSVSGDVPSSPGSGASRSPRKFKTLPSAMLDTKVSSIGRMPVFAVQNQLKSSYRSPSSSKVVVGTKSFAGMEVPVLNTCTDCHEHVKSMKTMIFRTHVQPMSPRSAGIASSSRF